MGRMGTSGEIPSDEDGGEKVPGARIDFQRFASALEAGEEVHPGNRKSSDWGCVTFGGTLD
jgi:hypothetical protein